MTVDVQQIPDRVHRPLTATGSEPTLPHQHTNDADLRQVDAALQDFEFSGGGAAFFEGAGQGVCLQVFHPKEGGVQAVGHDSGSDRAKIASSSKSNQNPWFRNGPLGCATSIPACVASRP
ncbi:hypothetical protein WEH80_36415 [Actinomycetes bacterium KLBMP 9759]